MAPLQPGLQIALAHCAPEPTMANDPFDRLPQVPRFSLTSTTVKDGQPFPPAQLSAAFGVPGGKDVSPQLAWSGAPPGTKGYVVMMYDPDAPTLSGFWHWAVTNLPASVTSLPEGAGDAQGSGLPKGAIQLRNDGGTARFVGAAPPKGHGPHRYHLVIHALDVEDLGVKPDATPAFLGFNVFFHSLGRAWMVCTAEL